MANEHVEIMRVFVDSVSPCKQENGCFYQTTLHCKILCEIKKIESENDCSTGLPTLRIFP